MSIPSDYYELLRDLSERTDKGEVNWKFERLIIELALDEERIAIWAGTDERTEEGFVSFALKDKHGETLDTWYLDAGDKDYDFMNRLYLAAKRRALGIPNRLTRIRESMAKRGIIGDDER
ncbi:hypothetical protein [Variovorax sp. V15]|uniref:hypothetical protein n=1 Tax=Variovorax sp. V15 TaxID=3065952 RepID=UPI0034E8E24B